MSDNVHELPTMPAVNEAEEALKFPPMGTKDDFALCALFRQFLALARELEAEPAFAGFQVEVLRDAETRAIKRIHVCPCDDLGGVVAKRL